MRVFLDVNILVRANERSQGSARALLLTLLEKGHTILTSAGVLADVARVLRYPRIHAIYGLTEAQIYDYVQFLRQACTVVITEPLPNIPIRDVTDAGIIQAALAGEAEMICTVDRDFHADDLRAFCSRLGLEIITDRDLLRRLSGKLPD